MCVSERVAVSLRCKFLAGAVRAHGSYVPHEMGAGACLRREIFVVWWTAISLDGFHLSRMWK